MALSAQPSVIDFGAVGDGKADDTAAFQRALDAQLEAGGGTVYVPSGSYRVEGSLTVPADVTLQGTWAAPPTVSAYHEPADDPTADPLLRGSVLLPVGGAGDPDGQAFITLGRNSTIRGLTIFYPDQTRTNPPVAYPWTVRSSDDNASIVDVLMVNPYQAVDFGNQVSGRHYIRGLYADALYRGVFVDHCIDVGRIENVHLWPFWEPDPTSPLREFVAENGEAFIFGRTDWEYVTNCFALSYAVGFRFREGLGTGPYAGPGNVLLTQSGADHCSVAVQVDSVQGHAGVSFSNSQIFGDIIVGPENNGMVRFTGCGIFGSIDGARGVSAARIDGLGRVSFSNCHFYSIHPDNQASPVLQVDGGRLSVVGCVFINTEGLASNPDHITLEPDCLGAQIVANEFYDIIRIDNRADGPVEIGLNIDGTAHPAEAAGTTDP
jgi:hypothetical protein